MLYLRNTSSELIGKFKFESILPFSSFDQYIVSGAVDSLCSSFVSSFYLSPMKVWDFVRELALSQIWFYHKEFTFNDGLGIPFFLNVDNSYSLGFTKWRCFSTSFGHLTFGELEGTGGFLRFPNFEIKVLWKSSIEVVPSFNIMSWLCFSFNDFDA